MNTLVLALSLAVIPPVHGDVIAALDSTLMRAPMDSEGKPQELMVSRRTVDWTPLLELDKQFPARRRDDAVVVAILKDEGVRQQVWALVYTTPIDVFQQCERLVFYDAVEENESFWVLYSLRCEVRMDRVERDENGSYRVTRTSSILKQVDSGVWPYLMDSGKVFRHNDTLYVGFRMIADHHRVYDRPHPYLFWKLDGGEATEVDDEELVDLFVQTIGPALEGDRPRFAEQTNSPRPRESANEANE
jgi:hypothetical protein